MRKNFRFVREEFEIFPHRVLRKIFTSRKKKRFMKIDLKNTQKETKLISENKSAMNAKQP